MKNAHDIIIRPIITENSMAGVAALKYTFEVAKDATKQEISEAVEKVFANVKVASVNTLNVSGKLRRNGKYQGYTRDTKKAVVTLTADSKKIEFFESMT